VLSSPPSIAGYTIRGEIAKKATKKKAVRGPKPDTLKLSGKWRAAVKKSLTIEEASGGLAEIKAISHGRQREFQVDKN